MLGTKTKGDILKDPQMGKECIVLKDVAKGTFLRWNSDTPFTIKIGDTIQRNEPTLRVEQARQEPQYSAFARTTLAEQNGSFARFGRKAYV